MIEQGKLEELLRELLGALYSSFSFHYLLHSEITEDDVRKNYQFLRERGISNDAIAKRAEILGKSSSHLQNDYWGLRSLGLTDKHIKSHLALLGKNPKDLRKLYQWLIGEVGVTRERIVTNAHLLGRNLETLVGYYHHHFSLLEGTYAADEYKNREKRHERETTVQKYLADNPALIGLPPSTMLGNIQYAVFVVGMKDPYPPSFLGTRPQTKRKKVAFLARECFPSFQTMGFAEKRKAVGQIYAFLKEHPSYFAQSIDALQKEVSSIRKRIRTYS